MEIKKYILITLGIVSSLGTMIANCPEDTVIANRLYADGKAYAQKGRLDSTRILMQDAAGKYKTCESWVAYGKSLTWLAFLDMRENKLTEALEGFQASADLYKEHLPSGHDLYLGASANIGIIYEMTGREEEALEVQLDCIQKGMKNPDINPVYLANFHYNAAEIFRKKFDFIRAMEMYTKAHEILSTRLGEDAAELAVPNNGIGMLYLTYGRYDQAATFLQKALDIQLKHKGVVDIESKIYANLAKAYSHQGRKEKAEEYVLKAMELENKSFGSKGEDYAGFLNNLANIYDQNDEWEKALGFLGKSIFQYEKLGVPNDPRLAQSYLLEASISRKFGNYKMAETAISKALSIFDKQEGMENKKAYAYLSLGEILLQKKSYAEAKNAADRSIDLFLTTTGKKGAGISEAYTLTYRLLKAEKKFSESVQASKLALFAVSAEEGPDDAFFSYGKLESMSLLAESLELEYRQSGNVNSLTESFAVYLKLVNLLDEISRSYVDESEKLTLLEGWHEVFEKAVACGWVLTKHEILVTEDLLMIAEKSKSLTLSQALRHKDARKFSGIPDSVLIFEENLRFNLSVVKKNLYEAILTTDSIEVKRFENKAFDLEGKYDRLVASMERQFPDYHQLKYKSDWPGVATLQESLSDQEIWVEFFFAEENLYRFLLDKKELSVHKISDGRQIKNLVSEIRKGLIQRDLKVYKYNAFKLYDWIWGDVENSLDGKNLIIVPDGPLNYLPFDLLLTVKPGVSKSDTLEFMLRKNPIRLAYGVGLFLQQRKKKSGHSGHSLLAMAPDFGDISTVIPGGAFRNQKLAPLAGVKEEVATISRIFDGKYLTGKEATETAFKTHAAQYNVLHIATHALVEDDQPLYSCLVFNPESDTTSSEDGFLYTYELYNLSLQTEMAILSACNTGSGKLQKGEGIMSLARGFSYAGCSNVVMSLWPVTDGSTAKLMAFFYENLKAGMGKATALHQAKLRFLEEMPPHLADPYYWGGFVLVGDDEPIGNGGGSWGWWVLGVVAVLSFFTARSQWRKGRSQS